MQRLIKVSNIVPKKSSEISRSKLGLGFEKLDRDAFDPEKAYDKVAALGVKWIRIQSGWAKTEKAKGVYDFSWLDAIVDNLIKRSLKPWICICYGNGLYDEFAATVYGAVGCPPIYSQEAKEAWAKYVTALVDRYKDRVQYYEIWNEPDGEWCWKKGVSAKEYADLSIDTAKAIRKAYYDAKIIAGAICLRDLAYMNTCLAQGLGKYIDAVTFHEYTHIEKMVFERVSSLKALCHSYNPNIEIIQGESGSQSKLSDAGALRGGGWTERKQAKQLLRHTMADLMSNVLFASYFSCLDMVEGLNGSVSDKNSYLDYAYFGVLGADFNEDGQATGEYTPKPSYKALQTLCSMFAEDVEVTELPVLFTPEYSPLIFANDCDDQSIIKGGFKKPNGSYAFAYWNSLDLMTTDFESTVTIQVARLGDDIKLVDPYDGTVYKFPKEMIEDKSNGCYVIKHAPIKDYPLIITFGNFE